MQKYSIWVEGFRATGQSGKAQFICSSYGDTFKEACDIAARRGKFKGYGVYNSASPSLWGCRLFDSEEKARRSYG